MARLGICTECKPCYPRMTYEMGQLKCLIGCFSGLVIHGLSCYLSNKTDLFLVYTSTNLLNNQSFKDLENRSRQHLFKDARFQIMPMLLKTWSRLFIYWQWKNNRTNLFYLKQFVLWGILLSIVLYKPTSVSYYNLGRKQNIWWKKGRSLRTNLS